jgi:phage shock protein PspC (stress-responsive transcriptional regulator)
MNKTLNANIGGVVFTLEEDAYQTLRNYLTDIENAFGNNSNAKEIVFDIEVRIAEIFGAKELKIITLNDVEQVIKALGSAKTLAGEDDEEQEQTNFQEDFSGKAKNKFRKIFRNGDDRILGGVASGLSAYFGVDPIVVRAIFIVLFILSASTWFIIYLVLWLIIPEAKTPSEKLLMYGKPINLENISKKVNEEKERVKKSFEEFSNDKSIKGFFNKIALGIEQIATYIWVAIKKIFKFFAILLGGIFSLSALAMLVGIGAVVIFGSTDNDILPFIEELKIFNPFLYKSLTVTALVSLMLPLVWAAVGLFKLSGILNYPLRWFMLISFSVWLFSVATLLVTGLGTTAKFKETSEVTYRESFALENETDTLRIFAPSTSWYKDPENNTLWVNGKKFQINPEYFKAGEPTLWFEGTKNSNFAIRIQKKSRGKNINEATGFAEKIEYEYKIEQPTLSLNPFFTFPKSTGFRRQEVEIILEIPRGKTIFVDESLKGMLGRMKTADFKSVKGLGENYFIMTEKGFLLAEPQANNTSEKDEANDSTEIIGNSIIEVSI